MPELQPRESLPLRSGSCASFGRRFFRPWDPSWEGAIRVSRTWLNTPWCVAAGGSGVCHLRRPPLYRIVLGRSYA